MRRLWLTLETKVQTIDGGNHHSSRTLEWRPKLDEILSPKKRDFPRQRQGGSL